jgi:hypothetical protein
MGAWHKIPMAMLIITALVINTAMIEHSCSLVTSRFVVFDDNTLHQGFLFFAPCAAGCLQASMRSSKNWHSMGLRARANVVWTGADIIFSEDLTLGQSTGAILARKSTQSDPTSPGGLEPLYNRLAIEAQEEKIHAAVWMGARDDTHE